MPRLNVPMRFGGCLGYVVLLVAIGLTSLSASAAEGACDRNAPVNEGIQHEGTVNGNVGQHQHFCRDQPQAGVDACTASRYLLAGDRVRVISRCGNDVYVAYVGANGTSMGWVDASVVDTHAAPYTGESLDWLAGMPEQHPHWQVDMAPEYSDFLSRHVPTYLAYWGMSKEGTRQSLRETVEQTVGVGHPQRTDGRYVVINACRIHSCDEQGLIWVDLKTHMVIGAVVHYFFNSSRYDRQLLVWSLDVQSGHFPEAFVETLKTWNHGDVNIDTGPRPLNNGDRSHENRPFYAVRFIGADGRVAVLDDVRKLTQAASP
ncbi:hypothetical protein SAMN05216570_2830 [Dyella sp. OK004]|uniref:hypothetical protein n=1 Tax=Dyella sp. OK004 TaxID=1855292 RepID=UPI0008E0015A|nr:hypothetical protein [Dyella sp. OK004]SFS13330.1 hypothetical protein SAMN05216570_2830 [Dyella sp. OK004]